MLGTAVDFGRDARVPEALVQDRENLGDLALALLARAGELIGELVILFRVEIFEGEIFELPLELPDSEAMGERSEDLQGLGGDARAPLGGKPVEGAHVVEAVGELDDHDA